MGFARRKLAVVAAALVGALAAGPAFTQSGGTVARYALDAGTISGMGAMGAGGGGMSAALAMMRGGEGSGKAHELFLRLGTTRASADGPRAEHRLPPTARFGPVLELRTPPPGKGASGLVDPQLPKGRLLLFWGCGEKAPAGQPVVIDFSKLARGQIPPGLYARALDIAEQWQVTQANSRGYGEWPHGDTRTRVPANASLLGAHEVTGNYTPKISFTLDQDFMAPIALASRQLPSGAYAMNWKAVPAATGYYAWAFSAKGGGRGGDVGEMVWWTSSASQAFGGPMWDWLSPAAVQRLIGAKTVMPPAQTSCTVPAEVRKAGGEFVMASLYAYGPERNFSYPPRPANARAGWSPEWVARARYRSMTMAMLGMDMAAMMDGASARDAADEGPQGQTQQPPAKPKCKRGLAGIAQRAAGLCE
jgi:hypothetical protein